MRKKGTFLCLPPKQITTAMASNHNPLGYFWDNIDKPYHNNLENQHQQDNVRHWPNKSQADQ